MRKVPDPMTSCITARRVMYCAPWCDWDLHPGPSMPKASSGWIPTSWVFKGARRERPPSGFPLLHANPSPLRAVCCKEVKWQICNVPFSQPWPPSEGHQTRKDHTLRISPKQGVQRGQQEGSCDLHECRCCFLFHGCGDLHEGLGLFVPPPEPLTRPSARTRKLRAEPNIPLQIPGVVGNLARQPMYTLVILLIWSLTCIAEIRPSFKLLNSLLRHTPTVKDAPRTRKGKYLESRKVDLNGLEEV